MPRRISLQGVVAGILQFFPQRHDFLPPDLPIDDECWQEHNQKSEAEDGVFWGEHKCRRKINHRDAPSSDEQRRPKNRSLISTDSLHKIQDIWVLISNLKLQLLSFLQLTGRLRDQSPRHLTRPLAFLFAFLQQVDFIGDKG